MCTILWQCEAENHTVESDVWLRLWFGKPGVFNIARNWPLMLLLKR
jgi:hypothetical protein